MEKLLKKNREITRNRIITKNQKLLQKSFKVTWENCM